MEKNLKPIKCWYCFYLGSCPNCNGNGCERFERYACSLLHIAEELNIKYGKLCAIEKRNVYEALKYINKKAYPKEYRIGKYDGKIVWERVK